ncbi:MAG: IclR family transcriptional regulator [Sphaerotilus natans subsp. sulfidivorans]|uniref:IclR family transcriptional regulator n=1 Tax=Sphaerotilus sulfidivorans TaxID=639200 RepID=UPI002352DBC9|nr:IclR family transcriptional regulator [Sphaerotilus sulfidivorans]MCK6402037.1 IclR family transcriptional regulator [Sphaerotilus sulfidivorans]
MMSKPQTISAHATGTQTLLRGLAVLELVAEGVADVKTIAARLGTARSTTHRLLGSLVQQGYLHHTPYRGYLLGPKLMLLGSRAQDQRPLVTLARPHLETLAQQTGDTVHLGVIDGEQVLYLDKVSGLKGLEMRSRVGQHMPLASTGVGKALMLSMDETRWELLYLGAAQLRVGRSDKPPMRPWDDYLAEMRAYRTQGAVLDLEENELGIRCVGVPVRDISGEVVAAISVASAVPYMSEDRMHRIVPVVRRHAQALSQALGWRDEPGSTLAPATP